MKAITVPSIAHLSADAQAILESVQKKIGKIPNLYATIGYSSSALKAMLETEALLAHNASFSPKEREAINLVVSQVNNCNYCLAAHTSLAIVRGFSEEDTLAIRKGSVPDKKLDSIIKLAQSMASNKGKAADDVLDAFFNMGFDAKALIEMTALVALRSFTNYVFANTDIPIDFPSVQTI